MSAGGALQVGSVDRIDERDRQIVAILTKDARSSLRDIAKDVTLSPSSIRTRIARLVENGFIERFTGDRDHADGTAISVSMFGLNFNGFSIYH